MEYMPDNNSVSDYLDAYYDILDRMKREMTATSHPAEHYYDTRAGNR